MLIELYNLKLIMDSKTPPKPLRRGPKVVARKSKEERDELDRQAQEERRIRAEAAAADEAAFERRRLQRYGIDTRPARTGHMEKYQGNPVTYRVGRGGRGGFMGSNTDTRAKRAAARPRAASGGGAAASGNSVGSAEGGTDSTPRNGRRKSASNLGTPMAKKTTSTSARPRTSKIKDEEAEYKGAGTQKFQPLPQYLYINSDEETGNGLDVDHIIELSSDSESDGSKRQRVNFAPHRLQRQQHKDRETDINDEASFAATHAIQRSARDGTSPNATRRKGKDRITIKPDPETMEGIEGPPAIPQQIDLSDADEPGGPEQDGDEDLAERQADAHMTDDKEAVAAKIRRRKQMKRPKFLTLEERGEYELHQHLLQNMAREFGRVDIDSEPEPQNTASEDEATAARPRRAGALDNATYLFQFPPIIPDLFGPPTIKPDPETTNAEAATEPEKPEDMRPPPPRAGEARKPYLEPGRVGKLKVHKSGKMTIDWGGTSLSAGAGTEASFLQSIMLMKMDPEELSVSNGTDGTPATPATPSSTTSSQLKKEYAGEVTSFGQVRGKIVVTPDWEEILG